MNAIQQPAALLQRRLAGLALLISVLLFWGGAAFSIPLTDSRGTSIYLLSPQEELPVIAAHSVFWQWQSLLQLGGSVVATLGLALLTLVLWNAGNRVWPWLGIIAFVLSEGLWLVIEAFRLGTGDWAARASPLIALPSGIYDLLFHWLEGSLYAIAVSLALGALLAYAGAFLTTAGLQRWVGWVTLAYACLGLGAMALAGATLVPPESVYLALLLLGVALLRRPRTGQVRHSEGGPPAA